MIKYVNVEKSGNKWNEITPVNGCKIKDTYPHEKIVPYGKNNGGENTWVFKQKPLMEMNIGM